MLLGSKLDDLQGGTVSEGPTCPRARAREPDVATTYRQPTDNLCSRRTCETSTERILMKVTAMESSRRRLHDQATQRGRARAVQTGAEQKARNLSHWTELAPDKIATDQVR